MAITRTPMVDDDGSGTTGTIINNAWKQELYGQIDAFAGGIYSAIPFDAAMFSASSGATWAVIAGNVPTMGISLINGHLAVVVFVVIQSSVTGNPMNLSIMLPGGLVPACMTNLYVPMSYFAGGAGGTGIANIDAGSRRISLMRDFAGTPIPGGGDTWMTGSIVFPY